MMNPKQKVHVFIVSDATGATAERVIRAALIQFDQIDAVFKRFPYINTKAQVAPILDRAETLNAVVIYSLVSEELRQWIRKTKHHKRIHTIDLLGPLLRRFQRRWNLIPAFQPGLLKGVRDETYRLAESIDYTLKHDDGQNIETLHDADLILLGVSRTSKTPTSLFLSCNHNLKVANIPIIPDTEPDEQLFSLPNHKVGLTITPEKLAAIRRKRLLYAGESEYSDIRSIRAEIRYSHKILRKIGVIQIIDVTNSSIEEIAGKII